MIIDIDTTSIISTILNILLIGLIILFVNRYIKRKKMAKKKI